MSVVIIGQPQKSRWRPYVAAVLAVAASVGVLFLLPSLIERGAMILFLAVVVLVTWFAGWRAGVLAIVLTTLAAAFWIFPPRFSIAIDKPADDLRILIYVVTATLIAALYASRERAFQAARTAEQRLAFALECAGMGAWYTDLKTGQFWWSDGMEKLFGRAPGDFSQTYEGFIAYIHPDDQDFVNRAVTRTIEGGKEFEIEHRIVTPEGQTRWIFTRGRIVCDDSGAAQQIIAVAADITARKTQPQETAPYSSAHGA